MYYDLLAPTPPPLPQKLPKSALHITSKVPEYMRPAAVQAMFPPLAAQIHDVEFRYITNVLHEPVCAMEGTVGESGVGKGYIDRMIDEIIRPLREHDKESERKLEEWSTTCNSLGSNKDKPERPKDAAILTPEPDMTNAALILLLKDAEREGNRPIYTRLPEIDMLDSCTGSHKNVTRVMRLNYDNALYGAQRASASGVMGRAHLRWKFNFACVPEKAREFFRSGLTDGTLGRVGISYVCKPVVKSKNGKRVIPRQGDYDDAFRQTLNVYLDRIRAASGRGEIAVPKISRLMTRLANELDQYCELADDRVFTSLEHRSIEIGWMKGCILYLAEGCRWTAEIAEFVEWSIYYDLWSKIHVFCSQMKKQDAQMPVDKRRFGPVNMLNLLGDTFTLRQWEQVRESMGKPFDDKSQLYTWQSRGFITHDAQRGVYLKTEEYLSHYAGKKRD